MFEYIKRYKLWFVFGGVVFSFVFSGVMTLFMVLTYGDPIGTRLQYLGSKLIAAGQPAIIERQSPEDLVISKVEEAVKPILVEKEECEARFKVVDSQRVSCETILDGNTRRALTDARKRIGG